MNSQNKEIFRKKNLDFFKTSQKKNYKRATIISENRKWAQSALS